MVRCHLNNKLYVRKSVEKRVVARNRDVCLALKLTISRKSNHRIPNSNATPTTNETCCVLRLFTTPDGHHICFPRSKRQRRYATSWILQREEAWQTFWRVLGKFQKSTSSGGSLRWSAQSTGAMRKGSATGTVSSTDT